MSETETGESWILRYPSRAPTPELANAFPSILVDVERVVYEYVAAAAQLGLEGGLPALSFYADRARAATEGRQVPVVRGWPAYPGKVPSVGVAAGPETEDQQAESIQGGFAGELRGYEPLTFPVDGTGLKLPIKRLRSDVVYGVADYYSEPLYSTVVVELIHENRDERDRLHNELRRLLMPLRTALLERTGLIKKVRVDGEKTEQGVGPPEVEQPMIIFLSLFTVHVYSELLTPRAIVGPDGLVARIDVSVTPADTAP